MWFSGTDSSIAMAAPQQNPTMNWNARNFHEEWKQFEQHTTLMFKGPLKHANQEEQSAYLLIWVGNAGRDTCNSWGLSEEDSQDTDTLLRRFRDHTQHPRKTPSLPNTSSRSGSKQMNHLTPSSLTFETW